MFGLLELGPPSNSKICGLYLWVIYELLSCSGEDGYPVLDHIAPINDGQEGPGELFADQDSDAFPPNLFDRSSQVSLENGR